MVIGRIADDVQKGIIELFIELVEPLSIGVDDHERNPYGAELDRDMSPRGANAADNDVLV